MKWGKKLLCITILFCSIFLQKSYAQTVENITIDIGPINVTDSVNKPHMLGVIAGPAPNHNSPAPDLTFKYHDIGVTSVRNNDYKDDRLDMELMFFGGTFPITSGTTEYPKWNVNPNNLQNYHFTKSDAQFQNWLDGGFLPFFRLGGEHNSSPRVHDYEGPRSTEESNWIKAGIHVVNRYNSFNGGTNTLAGYLDIWTEYPQRNFWDRDSLSFNNFWCNAFDSLKTHFHSLKIGGPGFNTSVSTSLGNGTVKTWVDLFLRELVSRNLKPDWIGFHVFSNDVSDFYNTAIAYRKLLRAEPPFNAYASVWGSGNNSFFNNTELICGAWGFDNDHSLPHSTRDSLFNKQKGAAHHVGVFIALQQADIERAYIYRGGDFVVDSSEAVNGLFYGDSIAGYKPVSYGFKMCSKMQTIYNKKLISPVYALASGSSKIWTLAGEDANGNKAILISNPSESTIHLTLTLNGNNLSTALFPYVDQYTITDTNNGQTPNHWNSGTFVLPPFTAHLITMRKDVTIGINSNNPPAHYSLLQNYPNPFNAGTTFEFTLSSDQQVTLNIFDITGKEITSVFNGELSQGKHTLFFDARQLSGGIYFYRITAGSFVQTKKMTLLR